MNKENSPSAELGKGSLAYHYRQAKPFWVVTPFKEQKAVRIANCAACHERAVCFPWLPKRKLSSLALGDCGLLPSVLGAMLIQGWEDGASPVCLPCLLVVAGAPVEIRELIMQLPKWALEHLLTE